MRESPPSLPPAEGNRLLSLSGARAVVVALVAAAAGWAGSPSLIVAQTPPVAPVAKTMLVEPPPPLLPQTLGKLARLAEGDAGDGLGHVDALDQAVLTEDGLKRFARSDYAPAGAGNSAPRSNIAVYQFHDASGAVAAYDYFRRPGMRPEKLGDAASTAGDELLLRSGADVVVEHATHDPANALTKELIDHLPKVNGPAAQPPPLPSFLPIKTLDLDSVKYALGPADYQATGGVLPPQIVGFDKSAETVTARYKDGGILTLIEYPTPEIAGDRGRAIQAALQAQGAAVSLRREGPMLMVAAGPWRPAQAMSVIGGIHLRDQLTWNKQMPLEFHAEVQKTYSLLVSVSILCGIGALAAVVLGLFFGGGRALVRVLQGKPAAAEPEFLRIDLRGQTAKSLGQRDA